MYHSVDVAKTHEIMAKFRPIAPKPALPSPNSTAASLGLRSRPCKARKRGRAGLIPSPHKRQQQLATAFFPLIPTHSRGLSLLPCTAAALALPRGASPPVEQDLLKKLQEPRVIAPQPVRPVGSRISVGCIVASAPKAPVTKRPEEVEEEVEEEAMPAVVSDSKNRVVLANSAYKEMVGQPVCPWLDSVMDSGGVGLGLKTRAGVSSRINGGVSLELKEAVEIPATAEGFYRVGMQWEEELRRCAL